jgi:hypothetical protein
MKTKRATDEQHLYMFNLVCDVPGLRAEEISAICRVPEDTVWNWLEYMQMRGYLNDCGHYGWFHSKDM